MSTATKKLNDQVELFTVNGFTVKSNSTYVIKNRPDLNAPSGFQREGTTKLPSDNVSESFQCRFVRRGSGNEGVWDTGFYQYSPCYSGMEEADVKIIISALKKNVYTPYCNMVGDPDALSNTNDAAWVKRSFRISAEQIFNSNDPLDRLTLYFALLAYQVTPKGEEGNPIYRDSSYVIVDTTKNLKLKDERAANKFKAVGTFHTLLLNDKIKLMAILKYLDLNFSTDVASETLMGMFDDYLNTGSGFDKIADFNRVVDDANTEIGFEKLLVYRILKEGYTKSSNKKITRSTGGKYFYEDSEIGADLKQASENIAKNSNLLHVKKALLLTDDED